METKNVNRNARQGRTPNREAGRKTAVPPGRRPASTAHRTAQRRTAAAHNAQRRPTTQPKRPVRRPRQVQKPTHDVVYTQPETFNRGRFILRLATVAAVVLALIFGMAIFFKVSVVEVSGTNKYTAWDVREASGIRHGENLLGINAPRIGTMVKSALPYVDTVRVGIRLPDTVLIEVVELEVVYAAQAADGTWWLISSEGTVVDSVVASEVGKYTQLLGVKIQTPAPGQQAVAAEPVPDETQNSEETLITLPATVKSSEKLSAALTIFQYLEEVGVIGQAASVNVEDISQIELWYGERYQVKLGDTSQLKYKVQSMKTAIDQMTTYQTGVLDVSFTTWPDEVGYNPFS